MNGPVSDSVAQAANRLISARCTAAVPSQFSLNPLVMQVMRIEMGLVGKRAPHAMRLLGIELRTDDRVPPTELHARFVEGLVERIVIVELQSL